MGDLAFDFETYLIAPGRLAPPPVVMSTCDVDEVGLSHVKQGDLWTVPEALDLLTDHLATGGVLVGANAAYDLGVAVQAHPSLLGPVLDALETDRIVDVQIVERLNLIARGWSSFHPPTGRANPGVSLAELVERHLGIKMAGKAGADAWRFRYHELDGVPLADWPEAARDYARLDAVYTAAVWQAQGRIMPATYGDQMRAAWSLHCMAAWGIRTDGARVTTFRAELERRLSAVRSDLTRVGFLRADGSKDTAKIKARVVAAYEARDEAPPRTASGDVGTDKDALTLSLDDDLIKLANVASDAKELDTWVPVLERGTTLPINPWWNVLVDSGRTSCRAPNLQNPPRRSGVRECFVPRPGHVFVSVDWNAAELRALAQICLDWFGESRLADAFRQGFDPHLIMAASILGISVEDAHARRKAPEIKAARQLAKVPNFGFPGGLGAASFVDYAWSAGVDLTPEDVRSAPAHVRRGAAVEHATQLKAIWLDTWPEMPSYLKEIGRRADKDREHGFVYTMDRTGFVRGGVGYTDGCNHGFQHLVAHAGKRALWRVHREAYADPSSPLFGFRPSLFVHDEIIGEAPEAVAHEQGERLAAIMVEALAELCPDVPVSAEPALMRRWHKGAEAVHVDGRLVPWEPKKVTT